MTPQKTKEPEKPEKPVAPVTHEGMKYSFTYTENAAEKPKTQNQEHPESSQLNWNNPLNGSSFYADFFSGNFQFMSLDGTRSSFDSSECEGKWLDRIIPKGTQIRKVETVLSKKYG